MSKEIKKTLKPKKILANTEKPQKSERLVSINEFYANKDLKPEEKAGFFAYVKQSKYMSMEDWNLKFEEYTNRTL